MVGEAGHPARRLLRPMLCGRRAQPGDARFRSPTSPRAPFPPTRHRRERPPAVGVDAQAVAAAVAKQVTPRSPGARHPAADRPGAGHATGAMRRSARGTRRSRRRRKPSNRAVVRHRRTTRKKDQSHEVRYRCCSRICPVVATSGTAVEGDDKKPPGASKKQW